MSEIEKSSGNVFADLELPNADEELFKTEMALEIKRIIKGRGLTQAEAGQLMNESQPNVSKIVGGRLEDFSFERLTRHLLALGRDIEISIKAPRGKRSKGRITLKPAKTA